MTTLIQRLSLPSGSVKDLGVSVIGAKCYNSLIENLNIKDPECLKHTISKGLGLGVVVGGSIVKFPQIILILKARSTRGLSLTSYMLETLSYSITLLYSWRHNFPLSTYGETFSLVIQNLLITLLIVIFTPYAPGAPSKASIIAAGGSTLVSLVTAMKSMDEETMRLLQAATVPLGLIAKLPQIMKNAERGETGQLSAFVIAMQMFGGAARLFTTLNETGDWVVAAGYALAVVLNAVLLSQVVVYGGKVKSEERKVEDGKEKLAIAEEKANATASGVQATTQQATKIISPTPQHAPTASKSSASGPNSRPTTPSSSSRAGTPSGGRKWARKVD